MYRIAELCGRSCCLNELWKQRNEADKCQPFKERFGVPGAGSGCLTHLLVQLLMSGVQHRCGRGTAPCDLLGRDGGGFWGERCKTGQVLHVSALTAVLP